MIIYASLVYDVLPNQNFGTIYLDDDAYAKTLMHYIPSVYFNLNGIRYKMISMNPVPHVQAQFKIYIRREWIRRYVKNSILIFDNLRVQYPERVFHTITFAHDNLALLNPPEPAGNTITWAQVIGYQRIRNRSVESVLTQSQVLLNSGMFTRDVTSTLNLTQNQQGYNTNSEIITSIFSLTQDISYTRVYSESVTSTYAPSQGINNNLVHSLSVTSNYAPSQNLSYNGVFHESVASTLNFTQDCSPDRTQQRVNQTLNLSQVIGENAVFTRSVTSTLSQTQTVSLAANRYLQEDNVSHFLQEDGVSTLLLEG